MANGAVSELTYTGFIGTKTELLNISISFKKLYNLCFRTLILVKFLWNILFV